MNEFRVLVTGSRYVEMGTAEAFYVRRKLNQMYIRHIMKRPLSDGTYRTMVVVQGKCPKGGVDLVAERWAKRKPGVRNESHPADWNRYGDGAGPIRNTEMVKLGADYCLAFPDVKSRGTWDCLEKAAKSGITTYIYPLIGVSDSSE